MYIHQGDIMTRRKSTRNKKSPAGSLVRDLISLFIYSSAGKMILFITAVILLTSLNILITGNDIDRFFFLTGIQILFITIVMWVYFLFKNKK